MIGLIDFDMISDMFFYYWYTLEYVWWDNALWYDYVKMTVADYEN